MVKTAIEAFHQKYLNLLTKCQQMPFSVLVTKLWSSIFKIGNLPFLHCIPIEWKQSGSNIFTINIQPTQHKTRYILTTLIILIIKFIGMLIIVKFLFACPPEIFALEAIFSVNIIVYGFLASICQILAIIFKDDLPFVVRQIQQLFITSLYSAKVTDNINFLATIAAFNWFTLSAPFGIFIGTFYLIENGILLQMFNTSNTIVNICVSTILAYFLGFDCTHLNCMVITYVVYLESMFDSLRRLR